VFDGVIKRFNRGTGSIGQICVTVVRWIHSEL